MEGYKVMFDLMNKNSIVLQFDMSELGEYKILREGSAPRPLVMRSLDGWIESRFALSERRDLKPLFKYMGAETIVDYIRLTHCASVTDKYWVRESGDKMDWRRVYDAMTHPDVGMAEFAMLGRSPERIVMSPEFATDGSFMKCWDKNGYLCKAGTVGFSNAGLEIFSEVFAYQLASYLGMNCVKYTIGSWHKMPVCICPCLCDSNKDLVSFRQLTGTAIVDFEYLLNYVKKRYPDSYEALVDMLLLDSLLCNTDRHFGNVGFLVDSDTQRVLGLAPIFDNNLSCVPYFVEDENLFNYMNDIRAKDGRTFDELYQLIKSPRTNALCRKAVKFRFKSVKGLPSKRLSVLNNMLWKRIRDCLTVI